jgi:hypothetical protein
LSCSFVQNGLKKINWEVFMATTALRQMGTECLRLVSGTEELKIGSTTGLKTIGGSTDLFSYIDSDYANWGMGASDQGPTPEVFVQVFEMTEDATLSKMFRSFGVRLRDISVTQHQIREFVMSHHKWLLPTGRSTFFLSGKRGRRFVTAVFACGGGWGTHVHRFPTEDRSWQAQFGRRASHHLFVDLCCKADGQCEE